MAQVQETLDHRNGLYQFQSGPGDELPIIGVSEAKDMSRSVLHKMIKGLSKNKHANNTKRVSLRDTCDRTRTTIHSPFHKDSPGQLRQHGQPRIDNGLRETKTQHQRSKQTSVEDVEAFGNVQDKPSKRLFRRNLL